MITSSIALLQATEGGGQNPVGGIVVIFLIVVLYLALVSIPILLIKANKKLDMIRDELEVSKSTPRRSPIVASPSDRS